MRLRSTTYILNDDANVRVNASVLVRNKPTTYNVIKLNLSSIKSIDSHFKMSAKITKASAILKPKSGRLTGMLGRDPELIISEELSGE